MGEEVNGVTDEMLPSMGQGFSEPHSRASSHMPSSVTNKHLIGQWPWYLTLLQPAGALIPQQYDVEDGSMSTCSEQSRIVPRSKDVSAAQRCDLGFAIPQRCQLSVPGVMSTDIRVVCYYFVYASS